MFTGIVTDQGEVRWKNGGSLGLRTPYPPGSLDVGASLACDGCCLTITAIAAEEGSGSLLSFDVSPETLQRTTLGAWQPGRKVNLERPLRLNSELGGHIVTGHIDGVARILTLAPEGESQRFTFEAPEALARFLAPKGSVALDGTSLTVNEVDGARFGVALIPHTLTTTTWGSKKPGDPVNIEVDLLARYAARLLECQK